MERKPISALSTIDKPKHNTQKEIEKYLHKKKAIVERETLSLLNAFQIGMKAEQILNVKANIKN